MLLVPDQRLHLDRLAAKGRRETAASFSQKISDVLVNNQWIYGSWSESVTKRSESVTKSRELKQA